MPSDKIEFIEAFKTRTKKFVVDNVRFYQSFPKTEEAKIVGRQLLRSSSSVGANYRAACRGRSKAEFYSKMCIVVEEADESVFWMESLIEAGIVSEFQISVLFTEAKEILALVSRARKSTSDSK
ncbi:MAG TPA: four helix bundle protein [Pedobacter sp.]|jgi:four helix bundle protein